MNSSPDQAFSMDDSETDAYVQSMVQDFTGKTAGAASASGLHRGLASVEAGGLGNAPEIGAQDSPSLFTRTHAYFQRCQQPACLPSGG
jgi:hypothetical protein